MKISTYRYGEVREDFALRVGTARRIPRVRRPCDFGRQGYFDLWLQGLSPSARLSARFRKKEMPFSKFASAYRMEMRRMEPRQLIALVALLSRHQAVSLGCFCEDATRCHRSVLQHLVETAAAALPSVSLAQRHESTSPVCYMEDEI